MTPFVFIIASLAVYRLTVLVSRDIGPVQVFKRLRKLSPKWLGCVFCFSITAAALIDTSLLFEWLHQGALIVCEILAMSAITIILDRCFTSDHNPQ